MQMVLSKNWLERNTVELNNSSKTSSAAKYYSIYIEREKYENTAGFIKF